MATWVATSYNLYLVLLWSDIGAATDSVRRRTACRSILTLISCTENEEGQSTIPYFCAIIENFSQIVVHLNHYIRHFRALSLSVTFRKHSSHYYMEESVLLGTKPLVHSIRHFILDPSGVFSVYNTIQCSIFWEGRYMINPVKSFLRPRPHEDDCKRKR